MEPSLSALLGLLGNPDARLRNASEESLRPFTKTGVLEFAGQDKSYACDCGVCDEEPVRHDAGGAYYRCRGTGRKVSLEQGDLATYSVNVRRMAEIVGACLHCAKCEEVMPGLWHLGPSGESIGSYHREVYFAREFLQSAPAIRNHLKKAKVHIVLVGHPRMEPLEEEEKSVYHALGEVASVSRDGSWSLDIARLNESSKVEKAAPKRRTTIGRDDRIKKAMEYLQDQKMRLIHAFIADDQKLLRQLMDATTSANIAKLLDISPATASRMFRVRSKGGKKRKGDLSEPGFLLSAMHDYNAIKNWANDWEAVHGQGALPSLE